MKYRLTTDFGTLPAGTIIDEKDRIEFIILTDKKFYDANPQQFEPINEK